jgi:hypothetical protein
MLLQCLFAFGAIITFSVIIEAPRKCLLVNGILGLAGWAIYLYTEQFTSVLMATFMSAMMSFQALELRTVNLKNMNLKIKMLRKCVEGVCKGVTIYGL